MQVVKIKLKPYTIKLPLVWKILFTEYEYLFFLPPLSTVQEESKPLFYNRCINLFLPLSFRYMNNCLLQCYGNAFTR